VGNIDVVYEALGVAPISFEVLKKLGMNGIFVFTGIPAPKEAIPVEADIIMRNLVLMNQSIVGTVNADKEAFQNAIRDLRVFKERWPGALQSIITGRYAMPAFRELLVGEKSGIKNIITLDGSP
jgi:threonine dehydrogenase-like Zn-dependent dehydrogenase